MLYLLLEILYKQTMTRGKFLTIDRRLRRDLFCHRSDVKQRDQKAIYSNTCGLAAIV